MKDSSLRTKRLRKNQPVKQAVHGGRKGRRDVRQRKKSVFRWGLLCVCLGFCAIWLYQKTEPLVSAWTTVKQVTVMGLDRVEREDVLSLLSIPEGTSLFSIEPERLAKQLETHSWIAIASVERILPDTVSITVKERHIAAIAKSPGGSRFLDDQGYILSANMAESHASVPVLIGLDMSALQNEDENVRQHAKAGIDVATLVSKQFKFLPTVDVTRPDDIIANLPKMRFRFGTTLKDQWQRFQILYPSLQDTMKTVLQEVDLRYSGKVILRKRG